MVLVKGCHSVMQLKRVSPDRVWATILFGLCNVYTEALYSCNLQTLQELQMLSSATLHCQVIMIAIILGSFEPLSAHSLIWVKLAQLLA